MHARPWTAVVAVLFAVATVAVYGSGTGFGTTASSGTDELIPAHDTAAAIRRIQTPEQEPATTQTAPSTGQTRTAAVPQAPADDPAPAQHVSSRGKQADPSNNEDEDEDDDAHEGHGKGHGLGNTYCQSLKGKGGPAFGHCIAAKAHELHQQGKHR
jgi:hypothetical protein